MKSIHFLFWWFKNLDFCLVSEMEAIFGINKPQVTICWKTREKGEGDYRLGCTCSTHFWEKIIWKVIFINWGFSFAARLNAPRSFPCHPNSVLFRRVWMLKNTEKPSFLLLHINVPIYMQPHTQLAPVPMAGIVQVIKIFSPKSGSFNICTKMTCPSLGTSCLFVTNKSDICQPLHIYIYNNGLVWTASFLNRYINLDTL